jgi:outer membrane protein TolC
MKITTYINIAISFALFVFSSKTFAQETVELTLDQAVNQAIKSNWQVKKTEAKLGMAKSELMQANAAFLPNVNVSETYINTTDPLNVFGFRLKQEIVTNADFNPALLNDPDAFDNFTTRIQVEQPLLNFDAFVGRGAAAANVKATELNLQWTKNLISLNAKYLYFQLQLAKKQKEVLQLSAKALDEGLTVTQNFYEQNLIQKVDLLDMQLRISEIESHLLATETQISNVNAQFAHFLGYSPNTKLNLSDEVQNFTAINLAELGATSISDRSDMKAMSLQLQASNRMLNSTKFKFLPRLNAFGSYEFNDDVVFGTNANNYMVGARLEWDIFKGGKNVGEWQKMKHQKNMMQLSYDEKLSDSERELTQVKNQLLVAKKQVELASLTVAQAEESFRLKSDRYEQGLEKTADVLKAEAVLFSKKINELQTINNYQQLVFNLELLLEEEISK